MREWQKWRRRVLAGSAAGLVVGAGVAPLPTPTADAASLAPLTQSDFSGDHVADVLATRADSSLYLYPGRGAGALGSARRIGTGWSGVDQVASPASSTGPADPT